MGDVWVDIPGFEGIYVISNNLIIMSLPKKGVHPGRKAGNVITPVLGWGGYLTVALRKNKKMVRIYLHRIVALAFIPNPEGKPILNHKNSIRTDNSVSNLEWCTYSENNAHSHRTGRQVVYRGEKHSGSKLTWDQVNEIRAKYKKGVYTITMLCEEFGMSRCPIFCIIKNKTWVK